MLTIISNIGDLEATGTVGLACLEVDPELPGAGCEGDGALIGLAGLIGGNGGWGGWEGKQQVRSTAELGERNHDDRGSPLHLLHPTRCTYCLPLPWACSTTPL